MRPLIKILLVAIAVAVVADCCKYLYKLGNTPDPRPSVNPYSMGLKIAVYPPPAAMGIDRVSPLLISCVNNI
jgi:hypothetical protein